jgi:tight adherence protein C
MVLLSLIALLLFGLSLVLVARAALLPRLKTAERLRQLDMYGFDAPARGGGETGRRAGLSEIAAAIGRVTARRLRGVHPEQLRRQLLAAGIYRISPAALIGYRVLGLLVCGVFGLMAASGIAFIPGVLLTIVAAVLGWVAPLVLVRRRARMRLDTIDRDLADLVDMLVVTVEAGLGLGASLGIATSRFRGPLGQELQMTMNEQQMGRSLEEALSHLQQRVDTPSTRSFVRALTQGEALGVSIGSLLRTLSTEMRKRRRKAAEEQAAKAPVKMLFPLVLLILPALGVIILGPAAINIARTLGSI